MPPNKNKKRQGPEILRAVRLEGGTLVHPGEEDQLEQLIEEDIAATDAALAAAGKPASGNTLQKVLERLSLKSYVVGYGMDETDADETTVANADLRANARFKNAAQVQKVVKGPKLDTRKPNKGRARPAPVEDDPGDDQSGVTENGGTEVEPDAE